MAAEPLDEDLAEDEDENVYDPAVAGMPDTSKDVDPEKEPDESEDDDVFDGFIDEE